jgi:D-alanyl-D-alanine carboxypeptidase/D-alanyl-D-alanine-endopeptidase (penicillin-binding protein 4)
VLPRCAVLLALSAWLTLSAADLDARLDRVFAGAPKGAVASVAVMDVETGAWLYRHEADQPAALASTTKALVAAAALIALPADFQFRTRVYGLGPVREDGVLPGLGVIGGGDPCLDGHFSDEEPDRFFINWAKQLVAQGVTRIEGDIVIDGRLFSGPIIPPTYPQDPENLSRWYSAPASAFAWNDNCIEIKVVPTRSGSPCEIQVRPRSSRITVVNQTRSVGGKGDNRIVVSRAPDGNVVTVSGTYSVATSWFALAIHSDPLLLAGDHLRAVLHDHGVHVAAGAKVRVGPVAAQGRPLIEEAHPLLPALTLMNQRSQNFYGEQILRVLGFIGQREGSIVAGNRAVIAALRNELGPLADTITIQDGSGLSYGNQASAEAMVGMLKAMAKPAYRERFYDTLKERDLGTVPGRVKTGTLAIATCLVG